MFKVCKERYDCESAFCMARVCVVSEEETCYCDFVRRAVAMEVSPRGGQFFAASDLPLGRGEGTFSVVDGDGKVSFAFYRLSRSCGVGEGLPLDVQKAAMFVLDIPLTTEGLAGWEVAWRALSQFDKHVRAQVAEALECRGESDG
jgi:hypothetical protein